MSRDEILVALSRVFEEVLGRPVELSESTTAADVDEWDSLVQIMLVLESEREFGIRFASSELADLADVGEFVTLIQNKGTS